MKVRLQSQPTDRPASFTGPLDCFKQTYGKEGWRGLYRVSFTSYSPSSCSLLRITPSYMSILLCRSKWLIKHEQRANSQGISAPIVGAALENATLFLVYEKCQRAITYFSPLESSALGTKRDFSTAELALAGAGAGAVTSFVL